MDHRTDTSDDEHTVTSDALKKPRQSDCFYELSNGSPRCARDDKKEKARDDKKEKARDDEREKTLDDERRGW